MTKVDGNIIYSILKEFKDYYGEEAYKDILTKVSPESKEILSKAIISGDMYELEILFEMIDAIINKVGKEEYKVFIGDSVKKRAFFWGFILRFLSVDRALAKISEMWSKSYDSGITFAEHKDNKFILEISEFKMTDNFMLSNQYYFEKCAEVLMKKPVVSKAERIDDYTTRFVFEY